MQTRRKWLAAILALAMILSMAITVSAAPTRDAEDCIQQMMNYYRHHQEAAATDIECLLYELAEIDPAKAETWTSIMDYWRHANTDMTLYNGVVPDGLPQDDSLCIVVLGYALASDGSMKKELVGRLEAALASAEKYPNAYIACTGGGTAKDKKSATEAGEMAKWLIAKGVDKNRIIVEDKALSTVGNALNTCKILASDYPHVTHLALVTSDYHLPRSCTLFHAQAIIAFNQGSPLLCVAANAAYKTGRSAESAEIQADNLAQLVGIPISGMPKPQLSKLDHIVVSGNMVCEPGTELNLQVTAHYNTGLYRDVTGRVKYAGIDFAAAGMQDVTVTYEEDGISASSVVQIEMIIPETVPPTEAPTEASTEAPTEVPTEPVAADMPQVQEKPAVAFWVMPTVAGLVLVAITALLLKQLLKINARRKAAKAEKEEQNNLPDDDSPLEYI